MAAVLELRWEYTPKTIFEERLTTQFDGCQIVVDDGAVLATVPIVAAETRSALRRHVEAYVESLFLGVQVATHEQCQIGRPSVSTLHDDGSRGYIIEGEPCVIRIKGGQVDLTYTRSDGTVVDTRRDRIQRKHSLSRAAAEFGTRDEVLARMLRSYRSAIADTEDELIHLYEVLDSLSSAFGSQSATLRSLGTSKKAWSRLGQLCNELPLRQGRHRGRIQQPTRNASKEELKEARDLAAGFIESYLRYLERTKSDG
jgi:hypothetical protein